MSGKNIILKDKQGNQVFPATTAEQVVWNDRLNLKQAIAEKLGAPFSANAVSGMTDKTRIYVYTGSESGYTKGNWYYWDGSAWVSGGIYNSAAVDTDKTLSISGKAADAEIVGQKIDELKGDLNQLSEEIDGLGGGTGGRLEYGIYVGDIQPTNGVMYWLDTSGDSGDDETEVTLSSISATYSGGDVAVGTALTNLTGITVKATYSDGSTANVTDYTLSGTIAEGENTITVSYGGKTTTFVVTGIAESGGGDTNEPILHLTNLVLDGTEESGINTGVELFENAEDCDWTVAVDFTTALKQGQNVWSANYNGNFVGIDYVSDYCLRARYGNGSKNLTMLNATDGEKIIATHTVGQGGATFYYINNGVLESMEVTGTFTMIADKNIVYGGKTSATTFFTGTINDLTAYRKVLSEAEIKAYLGVA